MIYQTLELTRGQRLEFQQETYPQSRPFQGGPCSKALFTKMGIGPGRVTEGRKDRGQGWGSAVTSSRLKGGRNRKMFAEPEGERWVSRVVLSWSGCRSRESQGINTPISCWPSISHNQPTGRVPASPTDLLHAGQPWVRKQREEGEQWTWRSKQKSSHTAS